MCGVLNRSRMQRFWIIITGILTRKIGARSPSIIILSYTKNSNTINTITTITIKYNERKEKPDEMNFHERKT